MGIGITSNWIAAHIRHMSLEFQSPMGIGITSNSELGGSIPPELGVSIPNGDRHYLELPRNQSATGIGSVSIPNGDRHYLELLMPEPGGA